MPAESKAFRRLAGLAEHHPENVYARNRSVLKMTHGQLHDYASTPEKGLPEHKGRKRLKKHGKVHVRRRGKGGFSKLKRKR